MPPPRVRPPTPVLETMPPVVASPWAMVASFIMAQVAPPPALAVRFAGSTSMRVRPDRSTTIASSAVPKPGTLCPPPRTATSRPVATACDTAACTSSALAQPTMASGLASIMKLYTCRASSYSASSGPMTGPVTSFCSAVVDMSGSPFAVRLRFLGSR